MALAVEWYEVHIKGRSHPPAKSQLAKDGLGFARHGGCEYVFGLQTSHVPRCCEVESVLYRVVSAEDEVLLRADHSHGALGSDVSGQPLRLSKDL